MGDSKYMDQSESLAAKNSGHQFYVVLLLANWIFYIWIFSHTPYGMDDWSWGLPVGWTWFINGEINGRYLGNLFEIIVTRSSFLKTILMSAIAVSFPSLSVRVICKWSIFARIVERETADQSRACLFLISSILFATIPLYIWRQTYGWVAGFSNYGLSAFFLLIYQLIVLQALKNGNGSSLPELLLIVLFGTASQLIIENVSIYFLGLSILITITGRIVYKRWNRAMLALAFGNMIGTAIMFGGSYYASLFRDGGALNGFRAFRISKDEGFFQQIGHLFMRFIWLYPPHLWEENWLICGSVSIFFAYKIVREVRKKEKSSALVGYFTSMAYIGIALILCFTHISPLNRFFPRWNYYYSMYLSLLFFGLVIGTILVLYRTDRKQMLSLLFLWLSAPGLVFPLAATNVLNSPEEQSGRIFLTPTLLMIEFVLLIILFDIDFMNLRKGKRALQTGLVIALLLVFVQKGVIYAEIGEGMQERERLIENARSEKPEMIFFPDFKHLEYLWTTEPEGWIMRESFGVFYDIPEGIELRFNTSEWMTLSDDQSP